MLCLIQAILIVGLVMSFARRRGEKLRRADEERMRRELAAFSRAATVGEVTASLAHELNQPLAAILSNAQAAQQLIERGTPNLKEMREILDDIVADGQRAAEAIRGMRAALKGRASEFRSLQLNNLIEEILSIVRDDSLVRNISIDLELGSSLPSINGDRVQLRQVIYNLVVNAFEAMDASERPGKLILRTRKCDREVVLDVVDSGTGVPSGKLNSIFDMFATTKPTGLGMGLRLSRSIVMGHNGRLWAENNSDGGATFHLALPAEESFRPAPAGQTDRSPESDAGRQPGGLTILIADDRESFRQAVSSLLAELPGLGLVAEASDGAEAVRKAAELNPDLILLDMGLPVINGVEAASKMRTAAPNAKILFLTQHDSPDFVRAALRAGASGYVLKVDVGSELLQAAMAVLRGEQYLSSGARH